MPGGYSLGVLVKPPRGNAYCVGAMLDSTLACNNWGASNM